MFMQILFEQHILILISTVFMKQTGLLENNMKCIPVSHGFKSQLGRLKKHGISREKYRSA